MPSIFEPEFGEGDFMHDVLRGLNSVQVNPIAPIFPSQVKEGGGRKAKATHYPISPFPYLPRHYYHGIETAAGVLYKVKNRRLSGPADWVLAGFDTVYQIGRDFRPILLQFKTSLYVNHMHRGLTEYTAIPNFVFTDFFRMKLRTIGIGNQHSLMVNAANAGRFCYYCTPNFFKNSERNQHYELSQTLNHVSLFDPKAIGAIVDGLSHHISFKPETQNYWRFSRDPVLINEGLLSYGDFVSAVQSIESYSLTSESLRKFLDMLQRIAAESGVSTFPLTIDANLASEIDLLRAIANFTSRYFGGLFAVSLKTVG